MMLYKILMIWARMAGRVMLAMSLPMDSVAILSSLVLSVTAMWYMRLLSIDKL